MAHDKENAVAQGGLFANQYKSHLQNANAATTRVGQARATSTSNSTNMQPVISAKNSKNM